MTAMYPVLILENPDAFTMEILEPPGTFFYSHVRLELHISGLFVQYGYDDGLEFTTFNTLNSRFYNWIEYPELIPIQDEKGGFDLNEVYDFIGFRFDCEAVEDEIEVAAAG